MPGYVQKFKIEDRTVLIILMDPDFRSPAGGFNTRFTDIERQLVACLSKGLHDWEIARNRKTSVSTIQNQLHALYKKADVSGREELLAKILSQRKNTREQKP